MAERWAPPAAACTWVWPRAGDTGPGPPVHCPDGEPRPHPTHSPHRAIGDRHKCPHQDLGPGPLGAAGTNSPQGAGQRGPAGRGGGHGHHRARTKGQRPGQRTAVEGVGQARAEPHPGGRRLGVDRAQGGSLDPPTSAGSQGGCIPGLLGLQVEPPSRHRGMEEGTALSRAP